MENEIKEDIITSENNDDQEDTVDTVGDNEEVTEETQENTQEETTEVQEEQEPPKPERPVETPEQKHARLQRQLQQHEKKYGLGSKPKPTPQATQQGGLTPEDSLVLFGANVTNLEDVKEVVDYAKHKGISISDALQTSVVKAILAEKAEFRATAAATNTGKRRAGATRISGESLLEKVNKTGELPDSDEDIQKLAEARFKR